MYLTELDDEAMLMSICVMTTQLSAIKGLSKRILELY
jgi:hypothetical protein